MTWSYKSGSKKFDLVFGISDQTMVEVCYLLPNIPFSASPTFANGFDD